MIKFFSSSKTRRLTLQSLLAVSAAGLCAAAVVTQFDSGNPAEAAQVEEQTQEERLDADTYYAIERLRSELMLTRRDLVVAGCDTTATHGALTNLLGWYETNKSSLYRARNALLAARKAQYEASRTETGRLRANAQAVVEAREALEAVQAQAIAQIESALSETQRQRLAAARGNADLTGNLRYVPGLSGAQKLRIAEAQSSGSKPQAVLSAAGLNGSQVRELAAMQSGTDQRSLEVAAGEATALPVPASLIAEREVELHNSSDPLAPED